MDAAGPEVAEDEAIIHQLENIEQEVASAQELIGQLQPMSALVAEYDETTSATFYHKAQELQSRFKQIRRVRGDGNCFYRALAFAQIEHMLTDKVEYKRFIQVAQEWKPRLLALKFNDFTTEDFCDTFVEFVKRVETGELTEKELLLQFNDEAVSNYLVVFLRLVTSGYLQEKEEFYANFIDGQRSMKQYCSQEIEPMYKAIDHVGIMAVVHGLGLGLRIEYMDQTLVPGSGTGWHFDFLADGVQQLPITLLYRHDHYDILYH